MNATVQIKREVEGALNLLSEATLLFDESHALTYALVMALANTPRKQLSQQEIDGLCQLAYELLNKLTKTNAYFSRNAAKVARRCRRTVNPIVHQGAGSKRIWKLRNAPSSLRPTQ